MIEKGKIGVNQFTVLTIMFTIGSSILIAPSGLAQAAKQDAWIAAGFGLAIGLLFVALYNQLAFRFPQKTFVVYSQELLGKWLGRSICLLYFFFFFILAALVLRNIGDFLTTQVLPSTPIQFINILFLSIIIMGIRNGLETFTRTAEIFLPWVMLFFFLMVILLPKQFELGHILPVFGYGIKPIIAATIPLLATPYLELVIFLFYLPFVNNIRKAGKAFYLGVTIGGVFLIIISLLTILVLGADITANHVYPSYSLAKKINVGNFLERVEVIMAGIWFITIYFKLALSFYTSTTLFAELFKLKDARQLYLPFGIIIVVLSIIVYPDMTHFMEFGSKIDFFFSIPFALLFPLLLLVVAVLRKKHS